MKRMFEVHRRHTGDIYSEIKFPQTDDLDKWCHDRIVAFRVDLLITDENENPIKEFTVQEVFENVTHHDVKVFQMQEHNVGAGKLIWEGTAPVRPDGLFDNAFAERCEKRAERVKRTIRVEVNGSRYPLHFYKNEIGGLSHILPGLKGFAIRGGYVFFDYRRKKRRGRFIGYLNEGRGFYFTKDIYQNIIFKEKHPKLNSVSEAIDWLEANAIGWKSY